MNGRSPLTGTVDCRDVVVERDGCRILHGVDLVLAQGEWVSLVGPNGAGKTTLLHALVGLVPADGRVRVGGLDPATSTRRATAQVVALMPQQPVVPEGVSVRELVALGRTPYLRRFRTETDGDHEAVGRALARLGLEGLATRPADTLSGGELQRAVLARALTQEPEVLLLDEPTSALDIGHQQTVLDLVDDLRRHDGITVVAAMHDLTLAAQYGERVVLLRGGRVIADDVPAVVFQSGRLRETYGARVEVLHRPGGTAVVPVRSARSS